MGEAKILIVEDEAAIRDGLAEALAGEGYRVQAVETVAGGVHRGRGVGCGP